MFDVKSSHERGIYDGCDFPGSSRTEAIGIIEEAVTVICLTATDHTLNPEREAGTCHVRRLPLIRPSITGKRRDKAETEAA